VVVKAGTGSRCVLIVTVAVPEATPLMTVTGEPDVTEQVGKSEAPLGGLPRHMPEQRYRSSWNPR